MPPTIRSNSTRCTVIGFGLLAGSLVLQGLSNLFWAEPARTRLLLEFIYAARGVLLQALNVMALALVTAGVLRVRVTGAAATCAAWALVACLIEFAQHPAVVDRLLKWTEFDSALGLLWNSRFAWAELAGSIAGGAASFEVLRHYLRTPADAEAHP